MAMETMIKRTQPKTTSMKWIKCSIFVCLVFLMASCLAPTNKKDYLTSFETFVENVEENHKKYNEKDWEYSEKRLDKFNAKWYNEFKEELTLEEKLKVKELVIRYHASKNDESLGKLLRDLFSNGMGTNELSEDLQEYIQNNVDGDLNEIINDAFTIGDSALKVVEEVLDAVEL